MRKTVLTTGLLGAALSSPLATVMATEDPEGPDTVNTGTGVAWFTGRGFGTPIVFDPTVEVERARWIDVRDGELHGITIESTDPRFGGDWSVAFSTDEFPIWLGDYEEVVAIERNTIRVQNDEGSWIGTGTIVERRENGDVTDDEGLWIFEGEGGYQNLSAYVLVDFLEGSGDDEVLFRGAILPEPPTEFPAAPAMATETEGSS